MKALNINGVLKVTKSENIQTELIFKRHQRSANELRMNIVNT